MKKKMDLEKMKESYGLLYKIENILRSYIPKKLRDYYGLYWINEAPKSMRYKPFRKNLSYYNYHELISLLPAYPCLSFKSSEKLLILLKKTIPIRNKIAHCHLITQEEHELLINVYQSLVDRFTKVEYIFGEVVIPNMEAPLV